MGIWAPTEWRRRWPARIALAVLVAIAGGVATGRLAASLPMTVALRSE
jgi:hypothetical protein